VKIKERRAFWDSSALVPLFCRDAYTARSRQLLRQFTEITVWWNTVVEIHAALVRLQREGLIPAEGTEKALLHLKEFGLRWREILPVERLRDLAEDCLDRYRIRSADSLQLGAALIWCKETPRGRHFICFDLQLCEAARQAGFQVVS
jgi:uncharacterized protein